MKKKLPLTKSFFYIGVSMAVLLLSSFYSTAQITKKIKWSAMSDNRGASFYDVQKNFRKEWKEELKEMAREKAKGKEEEKEKGGYEVYKRWEAYMAPRVYPSGNLSLPSSAYSNFISWQQGNGNVIAKANAAGVSNWTELGPVGSPTGPSPYSRTGAGRVNFIRFDPVDNKTMYVGTPDGGLWKSTNSGNKWTTNTDFLSIIGCSDLAINPANRQVMYLATGDLESNRRSIGILKSINGGTTWNTTGLVWTASEDWKISKLLMDPTNPLKMIASTNGGVFITTDGWATYTTGAFGGGSLPDLKDMELKPGTPATVYAASTSLWKSTNFGSTWTQITAGLPATSNISRIALGVSPGNNAYVYALIGKSSNESFLGLYRSANSGTSFTLRSSTPNLLGYDFDGGDVDAGQAFYDLAIAVSPTNAEIVTTGGINHWQSTNGGTTWTNYSVWNSGEVHADIHELNYLPGSSTTMFSCNDGGIFKSTDNGSTWIDFSNNLAIGQVVKIGLSANDAKKIIAGEQDNGTNLKTGNNWNNIRGGDGGECFIDYTNNNTIYIQYVQGAFSRSDDGGATSNSITTGLPEGFDFYSTWDIDPVNPNKLYVGGTPTLYTSNNKGGNWSALGTPPGSGTILDFAVAPSNTSIIYTIKYDAISKSTNAGTSFANITGTLPVANASLASVTVSNTDPNKVWVTFSGYSSGNKVFKSTNGGATWINLSAGLPNLPMNTTVYTNNSSNDAVYLGGDLGVYYLDNSLSSWAPFMTNLPNCAVRDLEIYYPTGKLRAGTYGRGVWETDLDIAGRFKIAANAGMNGSIAPDGVVNVLGGANQTFTITPDAGYVIDDVQVDGTSVGAVTTYTFTNVTADHKIKATFKCPPITLSSSITNLTCNGVSTGAINLTVTGGIAPFTYAWTENSSSFTSSVEDISGLAAGRYRITVKQANGCDAKEAYTVTQPDKLEIKSVKAENVTCFNSGNGSIKLVAKGGTPPYYATIDNVNYYNLTGDNITFSNLAPGTYPVTLFDNNDCAVANATSAIITQPASLSATLCYTASSTTLHVAGTGGTAPYKYSLDGTTYRQDNTPDGGRDFNFSGGAYTVYVKDKNNCVYATSGNTNELPSCEVPTVANAKSSLRSGESRLEDAGSAFKVSVTPNPSENYFTVRVSSKNTKPVQIRVLDALGRVVFTQRGSANDTYRFGQKFTVGAYVIEVIQETERKTIKVVKE